MFAKSYLYLWVMRFETIEEIVERLKEIMWVADNWQIDKPQL